MWIKKKNIELSENERKALIECCKPLIDYLGCDENLVKITKIAYESPTVGADYCYYIFCEIEGKRYMYEQVNYDVISTTVRDYVDYYYRWWENIGAEKEIGLKLNNTFTYYNTICDYTIYLME